MLYCGIDPGKEGGLALITESNIMNYSKMKSDYEFIKEIERLVEFNDNIVFVIEKVGAITGQGVTSIFTFGFNTGYMYGVLHTLRQRLVEVHPIKWKKHFSIPGKKPSPKPSNEKTTKIVRQYYPEMIDIPFHSGIYDAILIARYQIEKGFTI